MRSTSATSVARGLFREADVQLLMGCESRVILAMSPLVTSPRRDIDDTKDKSCTLNPGMNNSAAVKEDPHVLALAQSTKCTDIDLVAQPLNSWP